MLDLLQKSENPYYQFHEDLETYEERCQKSDPEGYHVIFPYQDELEDDVDKMPEKEYESNKNDKFLQTSLSGLDSDDDSDAVDSDDDFDEEIKYEIEYIK